MRSTHQIAALAAVAVMALTAACSRDDSRSAGADLKDAGHSVGAAASGVARSPDIKNAEADLRHAGHVVAVDTRKAAAEAKAAAGKLASDTRGASHDATHHDRADDKSS